MRRCAFLTQASHGGPSPGDRLLYAPLARRGWVVDEVPWRTPGVAWDRYEVVVVRSTWDYHRAPDRFLRTLETIDAATRLENPLSLLRWNLQKTYLRELDIRGFPTLPTRWFDRLDGALPDLFDALETDEVVVKPVIGASAEDTFRLPRGAPVAAVVEAFADRACLVQPFAPHIVDEGEVSLFHFGANFSHAILKTPAQGDFRVQEEHGGFIRAVDPDPSMRTLADDVVASISPRPLYARIDFVRWGSSYALMEVELIEPSLYFTYDDAAPERFADAFDHRMNHPGPT